MTLTSSGGYAQLITMLVIFVVVLGVTAWVTRWIANYQKVQGAGGNIEVIETQRIAQNKWIQIIRVGGSYKAVAISKDQVTFLGDLDPDTLRTVGTGEKTPGFGSFLTKALGKDRQPGGAEKEEDS